MTGSGIRAQPGDAVNIRQLKMEELAGRYTTLTREGKVLRALSVSEVKLQSRRCLPEPVSLNLLASSSKVYKNVAWYQWNPVGHYWELIHQPAYVKASGESEGHYAAPVSCPGVYGFFVKPAGKVRGLKVHAPFQYELVSLEISQDFPSAIAYKWEAGTPVRKAELPVGDLRFDGQISIQLRDRHGKTLWLEPARLGKYLDFSKPAGKGGYRKLVLHSKDLIEKTETGSRQ